MSTKKLQIIGSLGGGASVELDSTLTQSGKAADAKAVGDALLEAANNTHEHSNKEVLDQISSTVDIYTTATAPVDAEEGSIWIDAGSSTDGPSIYVRKNGTWAMSSDGKAQKQSDWNEVDGASAAYIRNKPFGYMEDVFANSNMPFTLFQNSVYYSYISYDIFDSVVTGDEITVVWDGTPYNVTAKQIVVNIGGVTKMTVSNAMGNAKIAADAWANSSGDDSGEPFIILPGVSRIFTKSTLATHSVIVKFKDNVVKLDPKFLPDEVFSTAAQSDWNEVDENSGSFIKNKPEIPSIDGLATEAYVDEKIAYIEDNFDNTFEQVQANWDETNILSAGYIQNKPFGYGPDIYAGSNLEFTSSRNDVYSLGIDVLNEDIIPNGSEITVKWGNTEYNVIAKYVTVDLSVTQVAIPNLLGNARIITDFYGATPVADTGEPFAITPNNGLVVTRSSQTIRNLVIKKKDNLIKLDTKFLPDEALFTPVQPDWNETDENSYAFIKNKPASFDTYEHPETHPASMIEGLANVATSGSYNDLSDKPTIPSIEGFATEAYVDEKIASINVSGSGSEKVILETKQVEGFAYIESMGIYAKGNANWFNLELGKEYRVAWDGDVFTCTPYEMSMDGYTAVMLGNEALAKGESDVPEEPFMIYRVQNNGYCYLGAFNSETSHEVGIYEVSNSDGVSVQANWDQIDPAQPDYIKNRPFYEYEGHKEIIPVTKYGGFYFDSDFGAYSYSEMKSYDIAIGDTYIVSWDGVEYECIAQDAGVIMDGVIGLGNAAPFGLLGNNEPFVFAFMPGVGTAYFALTDTVDGNYHTVGVCQNTILSKQIDKKFIPIPYFGKERTVLLEHTFIDEKDSDGNWQMHGMYADTSDSALIVGETYDVIWNAIQYTCECVELDGLPAIGNQVAVGGDDNGLPFAIARCLDVSNNIWVCQIIETNDDGIYNCTICGNILKKVDPMYLHQPDWNDEDSTSGSYIVNKPFSCIPAGTILFDDNVVTGSVSSSSDEGTALMPGFKSQYIFDGATYIVSIDNINYTCSCEHSLGMLFIKVYDESGAYIGAVVYNGEFVGFLNVSSVLPHGSTCKIKVALAEDRINKIDPKYLPDNIGGTSLPTVTASDAGKFLRVNSEGLWVAETIPFAEEATF